MSLRVSIDVPLGPEQAFDVLVEELVTALAGKGMRFRPGPSGSIFEGEFKVGTVVSWSPGEKIVMEWRQADWEPGETTRLELRFSATSNGTAVSINPDGWDRLVGEEPAELLGWFASEVAGQLFKALAPERFGDWLIDRKARRPSGAISRDIYRDPLYHRPNFKAIFAALPLSSQDYLLEVGCGGGAFLKDALKSGCRAAAIDHSPDMVKVAIESNKEAVDQGRLSILEGDAGSLPYPDETFTRAVMTGVFGFLEDPVQVLAEVRRVMAKGGMMAMFTGSAELKGTPAAPEPAASRLHFYEDPELEEIARKAGFTDVRVERPGFRQYAIEAGVPEEALPLFSGRAGQLMLLRKT